VSIARFGKFYPFLSADKLVCSGIKKQAYRATRRLKMKFKSSELTEQKLNALAGIVRKVSAEVEKSLAKQ
jgi:hypothetical protein